MRKFMAYAPRAGIVSCALAAAGFLEASAHAGQFGSFRLKPGEATDIQAGPRYLNLRVCNDVASSGSVGVTIGDSEPRAIGPGECTDSLGDKVRIQSRADGEVAGIYQPFFNGRARPR
jgi:hypothetical protein